MFLVSAPKTTIEQLAQDSRFGFLEHQPDEDSYEIRTATGGAADYTNSDDAFIPDGIFGQGINVAFADWLHDRCAIPSDHETFTNAEISYEDTPTSCDLLVPNDLPCEQDSDCDNQTTCQNGRCKATCSTDSDCPLQNVETNGGPKRSQSCVSGECVFTCNDSYDCPTLDEANLPQCASGVCSPNTCETDCNPGFSTGGSLFTQSQTASLCVETSNNNVTNSSSTTYNCVPMEDHAMQVASRVSEHRDGTALHASSANLHFPNVSSPVDTSDYSALLSDYANSNIQIVNESFGTGDETYSNAHHLRDWYARYRNMLFVKATGNGYTGCENSEKTTFCKNLNSLCVTSLRAKGTYDDFSDDELASTCLNYENPHQQNDPFTSTPIGPPLDAERPDLASEGVDALASSFEQSGEFYYTTDYWTRETGTSFATPTVTGLVALMADHCNWGNDIDPKVVRSIFRTAAFIPQNFDGIAYQETTPFYPAWYDSIDSHVGVGLLDAWTIRKWCDEGDNPYGGTTDDGSFIDDGSGTPLSGSPYEWIIDDEPDDSSRTTGEGISQSELRESKGELEHEVLKTFTELTADTRIRFNFSYNTCAFPSDPEVNATQDEDGTWSGVWDWGTPAVDYDLVILSNDTGWFVSSESFDDNNEGFDVQIPAEVANSESGSATVLLLWPADSERCGGDQPENGHWASIIWR